MGLLNPWAAIVHFFSGTPGGKMNREVKHSCPITVPLLPVFGTTHYDAAPHDALLVLSRNYYPDLKERLKACVVTSVAHYRVNGDRKDVFPHEFIMVRYEVSSFGEVYDRVAMIDRYPQLDKRVMLKGTFKPLELTDTCDRVNFSCEFVLPEASFELASFNIPRDSPNQITISDILCIFSTVAAHAPKYKLSSTMGMYLAGHIYTFARALAGGVPDVLSDCADSRGRGTFGLVSIVRGDGEDVADFSVEAARQAAKIETRALGFELDPGTAKDLVEDAALFNQGPSDLSTEPLSVSEQFYTLTGLPHRLDLLGQQIRRDLAAHWTKIDQDTRKYKLAYYPKLRELYERHENALAARDAEHKAKLAKYDEEISRRDAELAELNAKRDAELDALRAQLSTKP